MSGLSARIKKLETTRGAASVTDAEVAEANRLARRHAQFIIRDGMAGAGLPWPPTGEALPWPPTEAERAEIEEIERRKLGCWTCGAAIGKRRIPAILSGASRSSSN